jgi:ABC-type uncharacterized transport system fused permease/ATPase subunit
MFTVVIMIILVNMVEMVILNKKFEHKIRTNFNKKKFKRFLNKNDEVYKMAGKK